ncbi:MAG TPA: tRNA pseudouridine(38-40) synthase TruA [Chitinophagales bacterium]|nr:tRNA pseudouridine(38-40) synthase TruA [Chitinophagales bacterium]
MRYFIHLSYRGSRYHGWQRQDNAPSVQGEIESKLSTILKKPVEIIGCGRTDTGVHAHSYYAHFDIDFEVPLNLAHSLNSMLSDDIAVYEILKSDDITHARFSADIRSYRYFIHYQKDPFALDKSYHFRYKNLPNIQLMNEFCQQLLSVQDFSSFQKKGSDNNNSRCSVSKAIWTPTENGCYFEVHSNRFLRNMVRAIVGSSLMIGCNKTDIPSLMNQVKNQKTILLSMTAPAHGLHLWSIQYPENSFQSL